MKPKMTRGELRVIADTDHVQCGDASAMANMLLNSNPVYQVLGSGGWRDVDADVFEPMKDAGLTVRVLYTAPRDLVAVDEIAEQAGINPAIADAYMQGYHDSESRNTTAQALPDEKWVNPDISFADENGFAEGWNESRQHAVNNGKVPPVVKGISAYCRGWNAFREFMLNAGPVTAGTVPDGWKLVPVEPTDEMCKAGYEAQDKWPYERADTYKEMCHLWTHPRYKAMIDAAPAAPDDDL